MNLREAAQQATPREQLLKELMDSRVSKTEREHAAAREIERLRAAGQQALEALEEYSPVPTDGPWHKRHHKAITALRAALAEDAMQRLTDEPVAWISEVVCVGPNLGVKRYDKLPIQSLQPGFYKHTPLYTAPPKRKPLTDKQISSVWKTLCSDDFIVFARAIERAHGIGGEE